MTVTVTTARVEYTGNGSTTAFAVPFYFLANGDLKVYQAGVLKTITTHYTVSGAGNPSGGTVTFGTAPALGQSVVIFRDPAITQSTDYTPNDPFPAESHERALDRLTMIAQRLDDRADRAITLSDSDTSGASTVLPSPEATKLVGWNADGDALQNYNVGDIASAVAYADWRVQTFTGDGSETEFTLTDSPVNVANTDVSIDGVTQVPGTDYTLSSDGMSVVFGTAPGNGTVICVRYGQSAAQGRDDASIIYFQPAGSGAVSRTVQARLREVISVKDFGAVGDGVTDDTTAINNAISYAYNYPEGTGRREVYFPTGDYKHTGTIAIAGISLIGDGKTASRLYYYGTTYALTCTTGDNHIQGLGFYGNNAGPAAVGVLFDGTIYHRFEECAIWSFSRGMQIQNVCYGIAVKNCRFLANGIHVYGQYITDFPTSCYFTENAFETATASSTGAIYLQDCEGFTFERNVLQSNGSLYTFFIYYLSAGNAYQNHRILNNWFEDNGNQANSSNIKISGSAGALQGVIVSGNQFYSSNANKPTYCIDAENSYGLVARDNFWNLNSSYTFIKKTGVGNSNWTVDNPMVAATQEMNKHRAVVVPNAAQTINAGATDKIVFDIAVLNDSGLWSTTNSEFTAAAKGLYRVTLDVYFQSSTVGQVFWLYVYLNGAGITPRYISRPCYKNTVDVEHFQLEGFVDLVVGDKITFWCLNDGASNRNITSVSQACVELINQQI